MISFNFIKKETLTGSFQGMRYLLKKDDEKLIAIIWPEPFCFEITPEEEKNRTEFPFTLEGKTQAIQWLIEQFREQRNKWLEAKKKSLC